MLIDLVIYITRPTANLHTSTIWHFCFISDQSVGKKRDFLYFGQIDWHLTPFLTPAWMVLCHFLFLSAYSVSRKLCVCNAKHVRWASKYSFKRYSNIFPTNLSYIVVFHFLFPNHHNLCVLQIIFFFRLLAFLPWGHLTWEREEAEVKEGER